MARVIAVQHHGCETLGAIADALRCFAIEWSYVSFTDGHAAVPAVGDWEALVVLGGPYSVYRPDQHPFLRSEMELIRRALELDKPVLGICLGSQLLAAIKEANPLPSSD